MPKEFNFLREARLMCVIAARAKAAGIQGVVIPQPLMALTCRELLVMQRMPGHYLLSQAPAETLNMHHMGLSWRIITPVPSQARSASSMPRSCHCNTVMSQHSAAYMPAPPATPQQAADLWRPTMLTCRCTCVKTAAAAAGRKYKSKVAGCNRQFTEALRLHDAPVWPLPGRLLTHIPETALKQWCDLGS